MSFGADDLSKAGIRAAVFAPHPLRQFMPDAVRAFADAKDGAPTV
jgi:hypothetical protein